MGLKIFLTLKAFFEHFVGEKDGWGDLKNKLQTGYDIFEDSIKIFSLFLHINEYFLQTSGVYL